MNDPVYRYFPDDPIEALTADLSSDAWDEIRLFCANNRKQGEFRQLEHFAGHAFRLREGEEVANLATCISLVDHNAKDERRIETLLAIPLMIAPGADLDVAALLKVMSGVFMREMPRGRDWHVVALQDIPDTLAGQCEWAARHCEYAAVASMGGEMNVSQGAFLWLGRCPQARVPSSECCERLLEALQNETDCREVLIGPPSTPWVAYRCALAFEVVAPLWRAMLDHTAAGRPLLSQTLSMRQRAGRFECALADANGAVWCSHGAALLSELVGRFAGGHAVELYRRLGAGERVLHSVSGA